MKTGYVGSNEGRTEAVDGDPLAGAIQAGQITPPETISAVPAAVESVLSCGLSTDPAERQGSVHELTHELLTHLR